MPVIIPLATVEVECYRNFRIIFGIKSYKIAGDDGNDEELIIEDKVIVTRNSEDIYFHEIPTVKLSPNQSILSLLNREDEISPVQYSFDQILYRKFLGGYLKPDFTVQIDSSKSEPLRVEDIQWGYAQIDDKLYQVYQYFPRLFEQIEETFINIFPQVEKLRFKIQLKNGNKTSSNSEEAILEMKERGVRDWIKVEELSDGMFKTFVHVSEVYLYSSGTVILIDEFENSLGVNCIDVLTEIMQENSHLQFIITSHHPYIINRIAPKHWKIVTRKGSVVSVKNADEKAFARSHHEAFIQLLNLKEYREGIAV